MRREVVEFLSLGPLPPSGSADETQVERLGQALNKVVPPVSEEEAVALAFAFGPDECFGLAWKMLHLIESAPEGTPVGKLPVNDNEWMKRLRDRAQRAGDY